MPKEKKCVRCKEIKFLGCFYKQPLGKYGYMAKCKKCFIAYMKAKNYLSQKRSITKGRIIKARFKAKLDLHGITFGRYNTYGLKLCIEIFKRYGRNCLKCNSKEKIVFHHINKKGLKYSQRTGLPMDNRLENIVVLCAPCHDRLHGEEKNLINNKII